MGFDRPSLFSSSNPLMRAWFSLRPTPFPICKVENSKKYSILADIINTQRRLIQYLQHLNQRIRLHAAVSHLDHGRHLAVRHHGHDDTGGATRFLLRRWIHHAIIANLRETRESPFYLSGDRNIFLFVGRFYASLRKLVHRFRSSIKNAV